MCTTTKGIRSLPLSSQARPSFATFVDAHGEVEMETNRALSAAWSPLEGYAARLALVLHLSRWAAGEHLSPDAVDDASMEAGIVHSRWFGNEARRLYEPVDEEDDDRKLRKLVETIASRGERGPAPGTAVGRVRTGDRNRRRRELGCTRGRF